MSYEKYVGRGRDNGTVVLRSRRFAYGFWTYWKLFRRFFT